MRFRQFFALWMLLVCAGSLRADSDALLARLQPQGYVNDFAGVWPAAQRAALENLLTDLASQTSVEITVVAVPTLEGGEVVDFTNRLFQKWHVGKKGKDNGVMILAAIQDRKARIEVGYSLEGVIPDAVAGRILREQMFPAFRQGRYGEGLERAAQTVAKTITDPAGSRSAVAQPAASGSPTRGVFAILKVVAWLLILGGFAYTSQKSARGGRRGACMSRGYFYGGGFSSGGGGFSSGGFGGFGGGGSGGGGASGSW